MPSFPSPYRKHLLLQLRTFSNLLRPTATSLQQHFPLPNKVPLCPCSSIPSPSSANRIFLRPSYASTPSRTFSSIPDGPSPTDSSCVLQESEFHKLADTTIHDMLEKIEEYGDSVEIDGFDIDYGNEVLTVKLGGLGTYVINKQTPNRQIWLSSPVSGPSRYDWDSNTQAWVYRRTKENLSSLLESELEKLCGEPIKLP